MSPTRRPHLTRRTLSALVLVTAVVAAGPSLIAGADSGPAYSISNPVQNIAPAPNFLSGGACTGTPGAYSCTNPCVSSTLTWPAYDNDPACTQYAFTAINNARAAIGEPALVLPSNWTALSIPEQLFVMADMERVGDGYPAYLGLNVNLSATAQTAAAANADPGVASGFPIGNDAQGAQGMGGSWSQGSNVLFADYVWMYDDGWAGSVSATSNIACTSASDPGCWGHRDELLGSDPGFNPGVGLGCTTCEMGTGYALVNGSSSYVDLIELPAGTPPAMTFTWASELSFFPGSLPYVPVDPSVTTTTSVGSVLLAQPAPPLTIMAARTRFSPDVLALKWASPAPGAVAVLLVYRDSSCTHLIKGQRANPHGALGGVITFTHRRFFSPKRTYYAKVFVVARNQQTATTACLPLGRP